MVSLDIWQDTAVELIPDALWMDLLVTTIVDLLLLPATVVVAARLPITDVIPMIMATVVVTPDRPTVVMVDPADTASARLTTPAVVTEVMAATVDALLPPTTVMAVVDALPAPMGKSLIYCRLHFLCI